MRLIRSAAWLAVGVALVAGTGCGGDGEVVVPARVASGLAPAVVGGDLRLFENDDKDTVSRFANPGDHTLVADGQIWEIRRADRLVGALQITTVLPRVDFADRSTRENVVRQIVPGTLTRIRIGDIEVFTSQISDKAMFLWFGTDLFEVLQLKDRELEGKEAEVVGEIIRHQATVAGWKPLPPDLDDEDDEDDR